MVAIITTLGVGLLVSILRIINMTGNISSLHWYHRQRVREEDRKPFGRLVGLGTLLIGIAVLIFSASLLVFEKTQLEICVVIGTALLLAGIVAGLAISLRAMLKYNKGIF